MYVSTSIFGLYIPQPFEMYLTQELYKKRREIAASRQELFDVLRSDI